MTTSKLASGSVGSGKVNFAVGASGIWWEELGRTTLATAGDTITVSGFATRKYLSVIISVVNSGTVNLTLKFNNDAGNNYVWRTSTNGAADSSFTSNPSLVFNAGSYPIYASMDLINIASSEKAFFMESIAYNSAGATNVPGRTILGGKWVNTSAAVTRIDLINIDTGDMAIGSELIVLGHD